MILKALAAIAYSFNGDSSIVPYIVFALVWEAFYVSGLLGFYGLRRCLKYPRLDAAALVYRLHPQKKARR